MPRTKRLALALAVASVLTVGPMAVGPAQAAPSHGTVQVAKASAVRDWAKRAYGSFATWKRTGTGDDLLTLPKSIKAAIVVAKTDGQSNFIVETLDSRNHMEDLLVNEIGTYSGTRVFGLETKSKARRLQISADGAWSVTLKPIASAPSLLSSKSGDGVYLFNKRAGALKIRHSGSSNFVVVQHTGGRFGWNLLVNEIGNYKGTVPTEGGPSVVEIEADGDWTTSFR
jgi:hypothetical protein